MRHVEGLAASVATVSPTVGCGPGGRRRWRLLRFVVLVVGNVFGQVMLGTWAIMIRTVPAIPALSARLVIVLLVARALTCTPGSPLRSLVSLLV